MVNWQEIHPDFTEELQKEWEIRGFDYWWTKSWIDVGLQINDAYFADYLWTMRRLTPKKVLNEYSDLERLREEFIEFQKWSDIGIPPSNRYQWETKGFNVEQVKRWIEAGLQDFGDCDFVSYLRWKGYSSNSLFNWKELKKDFTNWTNESKKSQECLDCFYPPRIRSKISELHLSNFNLEGDLDLQDFPNLMRVYIGGNPQLGEIKNKTSKANIIYEKCKNVQEWLEREYSNKIETKIIDLSNLWIDEKNMFFDFFGHVYDLIINNFPSLEKINNSCGNATKIRIAIVNCPKLMEINVSGFQNNQELVLDKLPDLTILNCSYNQLISLDLTNFSKLKVINCSDNFLEEIKLPQNSDELETLVLSQNNFPEQDLTFLSRLVNIKHLRLETNSFQRIQENIYNRFYGSLRPLKNLTKLKELIINNTDIDSGLEYLPESLEKFVCLAQERPQSKVSNLDSGLWVYGGNLKAWKEAHPELMIKAWGKVQENSCDDPLKVIITVPNDYSFIQEENRANENHKINKKIDYQGLALRDERPFSWETNPEILLSTPNNPPIKLYNVKAEKTEHTKGNLKIKSYATLSYVWGDIKDKSLQEKMKVVYQKENKKYEKKLIITKWGKKALTKAIKVCKLLKIDYLWMDQLCIDQDNIEEKNQEVSKMRQYYSESILTLISINTKLGSMNNLSLSNALKKIVSSQWFTRSWTFQEGLLSKQTIFMFDDELVDGRLLAQTWSYLQEVDDYYQNFNDNPQIFATPLGWTYIKYKENSKIQVSLSLSQALMAVKSRSHEIPMDGIYSIIGLLPYGEKIKAEYKEWGHKYTIKELEKALLDVMKLAVKEGYHNEPLTWLGSRRDEPYLWWIPEIDEKGSCDVQGTVEIDYKLEVTELTENSVKLMGLQWTSDSDILVVPSQEQWKIKPNVSGEITLIKKGISISVPKEPNSSSKVKVNSQLLFPISDWQELEIDMINKKVIGSEKIENEQLEPNKEAKITVQVKSYEVSMSPISEQIEYTPKAFFIETTESLINSNWKICGTPFLDFTETITQRWIKEGFTKDQTKEWLEIGLRTEDYEYAQWLRDELKMTPEQVLNENSETELRELFQEYKNQELQIQIPPK